MAEDFQPAKPIYRQIAEKIYFQVIRGEIKPGEKLPSVREMAVQTGVNPNTVQRTYQEMERKGVVETRRGQGTFVTENECVLQDLKEEMKSDIIESFVQRMHELGYQNEHILHSLKKYLEERGQNDCNA